MKLALFMSGTGSNARRILEQQRGFEVMFIFTDTKDESKCNAKKLGEEFGVPVICHDIKDYYQARGTERKDMSVRAEYDKETLALIEKYNVDVVALCGYMSIVTSVITKNILTLNVHPANLLKRENGKRVYAGCMGITCIEKAVQNGDSDLRSTVHVVTDDVDGGPVVAVSPRIPIQGTASLQELHQQLKEQGDWVVYPRVLALLASKALQIKDNQVFYNGNVVREGIELQ